MLPIIWLCIVALMLTVYVVLDGFDLGAGIVHPFVAREEADKRLVLQSIGPVWDGNEVWLIAAGGVLYFAFPPLYASAFSGFYLPLMMVLWLLILRGVAIEFRNQLEGPVWKPFWDLVFAAASGLLAIFLGAALGNVVRGLPLNASGEFFLPLWTDFQPSPNPGVLDWYTVMVGTFALFTLAHHGALWITHKTAGELQDRARAVAGTTWPLVVLLTLLVTLVSFLVQPHLLESFRRAPAGFVFPAVALAGLLAAAHFRRIEEDLRAFLSSTAFIAGMLCSVAFGLFPYVLPASPATGYSLTIYNASAPEYGLRLGLYWFVPGIILAIGYFVFLYRRFAGKVSLEEGGH